MTPRRTEGRAKRNRGAAACILTGVVLLLCAIGLTMTPAGDSAFRLLQSRAAIVVHADFAQPTEGWFGARDWSRAWTRERKAMRIGQLALYRPSLGLEDYDFEFVGQLDRSLAWVFRASDLRSYYMTRLIAEAQSGELVLERSAVVAGEESHRVQVPVRDRFDVSRPVRISVEVRGSDFRTSIDGHVVDFFHDDLLSVGGVGFTGEPDDRPRLYWMRVRHHDDLIGKFCAWLTPAGASGA
ncbi:MAG TPA: hypothetical protein VN428_20570 [Bryobacteraceae bacterium]|nr:hypothetical protein [Bryobacteraceae bacterium]